MIKDINNIPKLQRDFDRIIHRVADRVGAYLEGKIVEKIEQQDSSWQKLHPFTVKRKGSTKAWIDKGELLSLITRIIEGRMPKVVKVGIFNHEKGYIAHILEFGVSIPVTEKMRKYLHSQGLHLRNSTTEINIPERPLFRLVFDIEKNKIEQIVYAELNKEIQKYLI